MANASAVVSIRNRLSQKDKGSAVFIAKDVVLTANHVFNGLRAKDFEVVFGAELGETEDVYPIESMLRRGMENQRLGGNQLDFAILKIGKNQQTLKKPSEIGKPSHYPTISLNTVPRDLPIYAIGIPEDQKIKYIHDNARVIHPFRTNQAEWDNMLQIESAEIYHEFDKLQGPVNAENEQAERLKILELDMNEAYKRDGLKHFQYRRTNILKSRSDDGAESIMPVITADCDTFHGASGCPIFARRSGMLIGVLIAGSKGTRIEKATWFQNELVLPISEVMKDVADGRTVEQDVLEWGSVVQ